MGIFVEESRGANAGEDVAAFLEMYSLRRPNLEARRVNVDFATWVVAGLDCEAARLRVSRLALIKLLIAERLE